MKLSLAFVLIWFISAKPGRCQEFRNAEKYGEWLMAYQQNPEPKKLYAAFDFGVNNKELAKVGSRNLVCAFFGSLFRADSTVVQEFYEKVKDTKSKNIHYGFLGSLWLANTAYSKSMTQKYLQSTNTRKFKNEKQNYEPPFDIYKDPISKGEELDLIWADFFATGNPSDIKRIASALNLNNDVSEAAKWSLMSNAARLKNIFNILKSEVNLTSDVIIKRELTLIIKQVVNQQLK